MEELVAFLARFRFLAWLLIVVAALGGVPVRARTARAATPEEIELKLNALEDQVGELKRRLEEPKKAAPPPAPAPGRVVAPAPAPAAPAGSVVQPAPPPSGFASLRPSWLSDFK